MRNDKTSFLPFFLSSFLSSFLHFLPSLPSLLARPALLSRSPRGSCPQLSGLTPSELPPSYFHASHPIRTRPALPSRSFLRSFLRSFPRSYFHASHPIHTRPAPVWLLPAELPASYLSSPQAISTLHIQSTLVRHSCLAPSCGAAPKLFPRFTPYPRSSGNPVSLLPAELF